MSRSRWPYILLILLGASSYGLLSSFVKLAYGAGLGDAEVTFAQATVGALMMWVLVLFTPAARKNPFQGPWIKLSLTGIFGISFTTIFYNISLENLDASLAIVLLFQFTWITILMESFSEKRWPTRSQALAIIIVMAGTVLAVNLIHADWSKISVKGLIFGLLSAVTYSLFLFMAGRIHTEQHPLMKSAVMATAGLIPVYIFYPPVYLLDAGTGHILLWGLLFGLIGQVIPTISFLIGIPRTGSALAAILGAMELPIALIGAFFILREQIGTLQWLGMLLILGGIIVSERMHKPSKQVES